MMPPARVLVGVDFSDASRTALDFGARLARQCDAELHVSHIEDPLLLAAARDRGFELTDQTEAELQRFTAAITGNGGAHSHIGSGDPVDGLVREAQRSRADVVVVGAHGMSGAARLVFGSTAEGLLRRAACPVFVVPDAWTPPAPEARDLTGAGPVVCGVDLTLPAVEAAKAAVQLAARLRTTAHLVHVVPQLRVLERWQPHADGALERQVRLIRRELERATAPLVAMGQMTLDIEIGSVPEMLTAWAVKKPHTILVLGRVLRGGGSSPPGSNAYRVLSLAKVPVLMHATQE